MERSYNPEVFRKAVEDFPELVPPSFDAEAWLANPRNIMLVEGENIGFATYEYEGVYNPHYFLKVRGREALNFTKRMMREAFDNYGVKVFRGMTPVENKKARWAARQLGLTSYGIIENPTGDFELFIITADEFREKEDSKNG